jgi:catechol 2,3-dioxygenase-like lactoylglutathione lyase family enzyme
MESPRASPWFGSRSEIASLEFDHLVIAASEWQRTRTFYARVVGAEAVEFESGRRALRVGDKQLNVHLPEDLPRPGSRRLGPLLSLARSDRRCRRAPGAARG